MTLHAGPIHILYDHGFLRYIKYGDSEVLRMIYFALRDENWTTYKPFIENEVLDIHDDHFKISYDCFHQFNGQRIYQWKAKIAGHPDGSIEFEIDGEALTDVLRNRAGFCILHPIKGLAGQPCTIFHPSGPPTLAQFPLHIDPEDPFKLIKTMQWHLAGHAYKLDFEGDLFETEDQRNWSDASYKTFCTPLSIPFPVLLKPGDTVYQKVKFKPIGILQSLPQTEDKINIQITNHKLKPPRIGIGASTEIKILNKEVISPIQDLKLDHYRIDIHLQNKNWKVEGIREYQNALALNLPVYIVLTLTNSFKQQIENFISWCGERKLNPAYLLFLSEGQPVTIPEIINEGLQFRSLFPGVQIGAGTDFGFTEMNRNRFNASGLDFVSFSVNPQMHASDDLTIIENIETQEELIKSTHEIFGPSIDVHISPLTFGIRLNPNATHPQKKPETNDEKADTRQRSPLAAAFTLGSLKALSIGECTAVTLYQTAGHQGILSDSGTAYPIYDALKIWNQISENLFLSTSSHPLLVDSIFSQTNNLKNLTLINYTNKTQTVYFENKGFELAPQEINTINL